MSSVSKMDKVETVPVSDLFVRLNLGANIWLFLVDKVCLLLEAAKPLRSLDIDAIKQILC